MRRHIFILTLIGILSQYTFGQISEGGTPISFSLNIDTQKEKTTALVMPPINVKALLQEDEKAKMDDTEKPFRFGYAIDVDIDLKKVGTKKELPNGNKLWLLKIHCPDAYSINLIYDRFRLGKGSKFFIYNEDRTMVLGAFTPEVSNNPYNEFATDLVQGNTVVLEYYEPKFSDDGVIHISKVIHGYVNTFYSSGLGTSANCNIDVMCRPLGNNWVNEEKAVTMLLVDNNTAFCSGCLVNNTQQDFIPYILTARHCYFNNNGNTQTVSPATNIFRFQYWRPNCGSGNPITTKSITGATLLAHYAPTDFALLRLNTRPPADWNVYYAGWDITSTPAQNATGIHHPKGDAMKISHEEHPVVARNQIGISLWRVEHFELGTVQVGSSGSPLFNQNHRIVGQLSGRHPNPCPTNDNACDCNNPIGDYGRFDLSWTGGDTNGTRLSNWLDPTGNHTFLDGILVPSLSFYISNVHSSITPNNYYQFSLGSVTGLMQSYSNFYYWKWYVHETSGWKEQLYAERTGSPQPISLYFSGNTIYYGDVYIEIKCVGTNIITGQSYTANAIVKCKSCEYDYYTGGKSLSVIYPNPVSNILNIDLEQTITQANALESVTGAKQLKQDKTYDIRLYDSQGNLLRHAKAKGGKVEFNVENLSNGIYFLHIYDGVSEKPEMRQIVVEH